MWEHSLRRYLAATLAAPQFFRLTIDLKKLKFAPPLSDALDRAFVDSISLSYLTSPVFQSNDVFHAVNGRLNAADATELLISDGFCSFRFEDKLLWRDFVKLFVPPGEAGAVLPIYVRARRGADKCSTLGVATLTFATFLSAAKLPTLTEMPPTFFTTCANATDRTADLPVFEQLLSLPLLTKETNAVAGVLTVGIAIDVMEAALPPREAPRLAQVVSAPTAARTPEDFAVVERCCSDTSNLHTFEPPLRSATVSRGLSSDSPTPHVASAADVESSHIAANGKDHLIQCEMMLLKLNAEQAHQKFRDEVKLIEAKSEERIETIRKENQKLRNENRQLEKKLIEFEQKLQMLQDSIVRPTPCTHTCSSSSVTESVLRRENEKLQLLLKAERDKLLLTSTTLNSGADADSLLAPPHAHSVHPVYHQPDDARRVRTPPRRASPQHPTSSSSSSSNSSPLSSRSRRLLAIHLKRAT